MGQHHDTGYSAKVTINLVCGNQTVPLSHAASTFIIARSPVELPPGEANIVFTVDDHRYERPVYLVDGMASGQREFAVRSRDDVAPF